MSTIYKNGTYYGQIETMFGYTPLGTIISYYGETAPRFYLACDGTIYNKTDYPELAEHLLSLTNHSQYEVSGDNTKFKVPDLRGEFIRGTGTNSHIGQGSGESVGEHQSATDLQYFGFYEGTLYASGEYPTNYDGLRHNGKRLNVNNLTGSYTTVAESSSLSQFETNIYARPTNTSVLYCISYKDIYTKPIEEDMPPADMEEVLSPLPSVMSRRMIYSTTEQVIGQWIDGKPLYQKVVQLTNQQFGDVNTTKYFNLMDATDLSIVSMKATISFVMGGATYMLNVDSTLFNDAGTLNSLRTIVAYDTSTKKVRLKTIQSITGTVENIPINDITAIIQYTKTTD